MSQCEIQMCTLRPEVVNLDSADQFAMILACHIADMEAYRKCQAKQEALATWIEER
jgi:hypothetical protein